MTMFSPESRRFCGGYGGGEGFVVMSQLQGCSNFSSVGSDLVNVDMAEDELRTDSLNESSSKERDDDEWLQLSIGGRSHPAVVVTQDLGTSVKNNGNGSGLVELELMPTTSNNSTSIITPSALQPEFRPPRPVTNLGGFEINWAFRPIPITIAAPNSSSFTSQSASYFPRPFQLYPDGVDTAAPAAVDFRVVQPPRRPHSGIWFTLQASQNQEKQPFLPQISKSYLRIKDGRMTVRVVTKYLVNKLSLEDESEIEVRCKGQRLLPFLTLQHVRDNIWSSPRDFITLLPNSSTTHHIMVLHYARTNPSN